MREAIFFEKYKQLTYFTSHNTSTTIDCSTLGKALKVLEYCGVSQTLIIK